MTAGKRKALHIGYHFDPSLSGRGGVVTYQTGLMKALVRNGWDVTFLFGGRHTIIGKPRIRKDTVAGIRTVEIVDSPLWHLDFGCDPADHVSNRTMEKMFGEVLIEERPDVVHVHDPRLLPSSIVQEIARRGIPSVKLIHNYFDLCPQGELMYRGTSPCVDFEEGRRCRECLPCLRRPSFLKERISDSLRDTFLHPHLKSGWRMLKRSRGTASPAGEVTPSPFPAARFLERRTSCVADLNRFDRVLFSSRASAEIFRRNGLRDGKARVVPITVESIGRIRRRPPRGPGYPVVFGYLTGASSVKGIGTLLESFRRLDQEKARLVAFGFENPAEYRKQYPQRNAGFFGPYRPADLDGILSKIDVGLVPSVWEEVFGLVGIEFLAAGIPVIGSRIGGIPEWLEDGVNGFLAAPGDPADLHDKMRRIVEDPGLIPCLQRGIKAWKPMGEHARDIEQVYGELLSKQ